MAAPDVFICHSSKDKAQVRDLYASLRARDVDPWFDDKSLIPGQDWELEIRKAVLQAKVVLVCLSRDAVSQAGYLHKEIKFALDEADKKPEGTIYIIPAKLEECDVPPRLRDKHWVALYEPDGLKKLLSAIQEATKRTTTLNQGAGAPEERVITPDMDRTGGPTRVRKWIRTGAIVVVALVALAGWLLRHFVTGGGDFANTRGSDGPSLQSRVAPVASPLPATVEPSSHVKTEAAATARPPSTSLSLPGPRPSGVRKTTTGVSTRMRSASHRAVNATGGSETPPKDSSAHEPSLEELVDLAGFR